MNPIAANDPLSRSADLVAANVDRLRALFPSAFTEGRIDFDVLKQLLGGAVDERPEKYGLNWHGKRAARQHALTPSAATLRPAPEDSVDWDTTQNLMIEGDNLEVLKLLQKSYSGKVKLIYIDPPYNTGNDFVYPDNFRDPIAQYKREIGAVDDEGHATSNEEETQGGRHTKWLNMMYPRLRLARNLMREDGVIAISIDDNEQPNARKLLDDVFGEENFIATIVWQKRYVSNVTAKWLSDMHDFVLVYAKSRDLVQVNTWDRTEEQLAAYKNPDDDSRGNWRAQDLSASKPYAAGQFTITGPTGLQFDPPPNRYWRCNREQFEQWKADNRIWWGVNKDARPMLKAFLAETERGITPHTWWDYEFAGHNKEATLELKDLFDGDAPFDTPKPVKLMSRLIQLFCGDSGLVLDFFCGSATFPHAVMECNASGASSLRFCAVQLPEPVVRDGYQTIADIAKERLRRAGKKVKADAPLFVGDVGFRVYKLDSSNIRPWDPSPADLPGAIQYHTDNILEGRTEDDILTELLLKLGLDLCVPIEPTTVAGKTVHSIGGVLFVCLAERITAAEAVPLAKGIADLHKASGGVGESMVVFRDSAFEGDDVVKTNLTENLRQLGLTNVRSL